MHQSQEEYTILTDFKQLLATLWVRFIFLH